METIFAIIFFGSTIILGAKFLQTRAQRINKLNDDYRTEKMIRSCAAQEAFELNILQASQILQKKFPKKIPLIQSREQRVLSRILEIPHKKNCLLLQPFYDLKKQFRQGVPNSIYLLKETPR